MSQIEKPAILSQTVYRNRLHKLLISKNLIPRRCRPISKKISSHLNQIFIKNPNIQSKKEQMVEDNHPLSSKGEMTLCSRPTSVA